ncbi:MAG: hypothetical protein ACK4WH_06105 [Phycisphaerales bacterium]
MTITNTAILLAQSSAERAPVRLFLVIGLLMAAVLALGLVIMQLRKRLLGGDSEGASSGSILEDIRAMRRRGEISEQEFQTMRRQIVAKLSAPSAVGLSGATQASDRPINLPKGEGASLIATSLEPVIETPSIPPENTCAEPRALPIHQEGHNAPGGIAPSPRDRPFTDGADG